MKEERKTGYAPARDQEGLIADPLAGYPAYVKAMAVYDRVIEDTDRMMIDVRSREIAAQMVRSSGSVCANFEEGYGRGTTAEFIHRLGIGMGEARGTRGRYYRSRRFLPAELVDIRLREASEVIALLASTIAGLERRKGESPR